MWIVMFYDEVAGLFVDEESRVFDTKEEARCYSNRVNKKFADDQGIEVADLGDYYTPVFVEKG